MIWRYHYFWKRPYSIPTFTSSGAKMLGFQDFGVNIKGFGLFPCVFSWVGQEPWTGNLISWDAESLVNTWIFMNHPNQPNYNTIYSIYSLKQGVCKRKQHHSVFNMYAKELQFKPQCQSSMVSSRELPSKSPAPGVPPYPPKKVWKMIFIFHEWGYLYSLEVSCSRAASFAATRLQLGWNSGKEPRIYDKNLWNLKLNLI